MNRKCKQCHTEFDISDRGKTRMKEFCSDKCKRLFHTNLTMDRKRIKELENTLISALQTIESIADAVDKLSKAWDKASESQLRYALSVEQTKTVPDHVVDKREEARMSGKEFRKNIGVMKTAEEKRINRIINDEFKY